MKTFLKHEFKIQLMLITVLLSTFVLALTLNDPTFSKVFIIDFFLLALVQYIVNIIKHHNIQFLKTDSRYFYIYFSTFVVVSFLLYLSSDFLNATVLLNILEVVGISWVILSPILIFQSLCISWSDSKNKI
ncbi:hypothetical protein AR438_12175 [Chryseobacterium aquaticum]|uniref:Uncharacterized protein n=1 Tax=Chryseobacterium aquaticum TaxID=452084 RepID=A0A0Q3P6C7_9FLAO|nr:hypothetical protein AR438_12175 [Chryseobacterium aquaticum]